MKKFCLISLIALLYFDITYANSPMWKIADNWICNPKLHTKIKLDGTVVGINELAITHIIDFKNSKIVSNSGNSIGKITDKFYVHNSNIGYVENIFVVDWKGWGNYSSYIKHDLKTDEFWKMGSSGPPRGIVYSSFSKCDPL